MNTKLKLLAVCSVALLAACVTSKRVSRFVEQPKFNLSCDYDVVQEDGHFFVRPNHNPTSEYKMRGDFDASVLLFLTDSHGRTNLIMVDVPANVKEAPIPSAYTIAAIGSDQCTAYHAEDRG